MKFNPFLFFYRRPLFLLVIYILLSLLLMNSNDARSLHGIRSVSLQFVEFFANIRHDISVWKDYQNEAHRLRTENALLKLTRQRLQEALLRERRLQNLVRLPEETEYDFIAARVIGFGIEHGVRSLILNVGKKDSITENMTVINGDGLIGRIISVADNQSITQVLMDHNCLVSARLQKSRESGTISWTGNSWLNLLYISRDVPVLLGEVVMTSGLSEIYPPNLIIGYVSHIEQNEYDLFKDIRVNPAVNFKALEEVVVLKILKAHLAEQAQGE